ncbi:sensor domain-containing protein [Nocardia jiangxiensis]|uniref:Sensor domain-containing protein n=1 Tax=Nocardia jiangxiensis TaxID=282685 RepID=A0ABW6S253_9NOCA|nr:sensor domain-containing protein [Nocardia jiangxiensis]
MSGIDAMPEARRTWTVRALLAAAAVFAAGCSSPHGGSALPPVSPAAAPSTVTAAPLTDSAALQAKLLSGTDIPPEYQALDDGSGGGDAPTTTAPDRSHTDPAACAKVLDAVNDQVPGASAHGAVHYSTAGFDSIDIDAASYPSARAAEAFGAVQDLLHRCGSYSGTDADGTSVSYQVGALDEPRAGDASVSFQVRTSSQGLTLYSAATVALVGSTVVQIARAGQKPVDPAALRSITGTQIQRLQGISGP